jgi:hypothetical protein
VDAESLTAEQRQSLRSELENRKRMQVRAQWINSLRERATIEDYRASFL